MDRPKEGENTLTVLEGICPSHAPRSIEAIRIPYANIALKEDRRCSSIYASL